MLGFSDSLLEVKISAFQIKDFILVALLLSHFCQAQQLALWNVGQGQWLTLKHQKVCLHFDMGGESFPYPVTNWCSELENQVFYSHFDNDHTNLTNKFAKTLKNICFHLKKPQPTLSFLPSQWQACKKPLPTNWVKIFQPHSTYSSKNDRGKVFLLLEEVLVLGDISRLREKELMPKLSLSLISTLILGHHGSAKSNSALLLKNMIHLKRALVSARFSKYGHPHRDVLQRIQKLKNLPVITTEKSGHIFFRADKADTPLLNL